jgi:hypothetical protein
MLIIIYLFQLNPMYFYFSTPTILILLIFNFQFLFNFILKLITFNQLPILILSNSYNLALF